MFDIDGSPKNRSKKLNKKKERKRVALKVIDSLCDRADEYEIKN